jgi:tRNA-dihydrouridine synthase B
MSGVTDHTFRHIQKKYGKPMLVFTEFTSVDGICAGASPLLRDFLYDESQRPIVAQIYGTNPDNFYKTALILCQLGFDGIDINMGCPSKRIAHKGSGAGLIRTPVLAQKIVRATQRAVYDWQNGATVRDCAQAGGDEIPPAIVDEVETRHGRLPPAYQLRRPIPVSVKTRIGYATPQVQEWIPLLLETTPAAISIHGRTLAQGYAGDADWDAIGAAAEIVHAAGTVILGNGDVRSSAQAQARSDDYGVDGALIGRASYGNPYVFVGESPRPAAQDKYHILQIALEHARLFEATYHTLDRYSFLPMRKHLGWYVRELPGASHLRRMLTQTTSRAAAVAVIEEYLAYRRAWDR